MKESTREFINVFENNLYKIQLDHPDVGWYLLRFDESGKCTHDYLQDTFEMAVKQASDLFGVPVENWKKNTAHNNG